MRALRRTGLPTRVVSRVLVLNRILTGRSTLDSAVLGSRACSAGLVLKHWSLLATCRTYFALSIRINSKFGAGLLLEATASLVLLSGRRLDLRPVVKVVSIILPTCYLCAYKITQVKNPCSHRNDYVNVSVLLRTEEMLTFLCVRPFNLLFCMCEFWSASRGAFCFALCFCDK